jgi:RsiW-degrading membrane proteinase PrsW (M82 family)
MVPAFLLDAPIGLLPVLAFLGVLRHVDAHRLVPFSTVLLMLAAGGALAVAGYFVNGLVLDFVAFDQRTFSRYVAPVIEECLKASLLVWLFARNRIGFMVDAAIIGFAVGAGFSVVENVYYLSTLSDASLGTWIVRGFGTAIMHGGATAVFGVLAQSLTERHAHFHPQLYLPGLAVAIALHSAFNHFPGSPLTATLATLVVFPGTLLLVFAKSEHAIHDWLLHDYESHEHLLQDLRTGDFTHSEAGRLIGDLAQRFDAAHVADMFAYIRLHTQLVLRAEKLLLAREGGTDARLQQDDRDDFAKLHALERRIGRTGLMAIWPHLHFSRQELWELYELEHEAFPEVAQHGHPRRWFHVRAQLRRLRQRLRQALLGSRRLTLVLHRWLRAKMRRAA